MVVVGAVTVAVVGFWVNTVVLVSTPVVAARRCPGAFALPEAVEVELEERCSTFISFLVSRRCFSRTCKFSNRGNFECAGKTFEKCC